MLPKPFFFRSFSLPLLAHLLQPSLMMLAKGKEKTFLGSFHSMIEMDKADMQLIMLTMETIMETIMVISTLSNKEMDFVALLVITCVHSKFSCSLIDLPILIQISTPNQL